MVFTVADHVDRAKEGIRCAAWAARPELTPQL